MIFELMMFLLIICFLSGLSFWVRFRPLQVNPALGIDNWYWLLCIEDVKKYRRIPARLPYFMLEVEEQWYPPLYSFIMSFFPMEVLKKHAGQLAQAMDLVNGVMIFLSVLWVSGNLFLAAISAFSYSLAFLPLTYNNQLQPRGVANVVLTLAVFGTWFFLASGGWLLWTGVLALSVILLFLHKMTAQMWAVYLLGFGIWARDWTVPALLPASMLVAALVSKGFYFKILKAHWDIVSFWHANIDYLGSHQYYESDRYGNGTFSSTATHQKGVRHSMGKGLSLFQYNVYILILPAILPLTRVQPSNPMEGFLWCWLGMTYFWALLTTFVPPFKALGAGCYYLYQSYTPLFLLVSLAPRHLLGTSQVLLYVLWGLALFISGALWLKYCRTSRKKNEDRSDLGRVLDYLKTQPKDGVFCIPFTLPDITAYWTRKKVFWGGHGFGFNKWLKPYFPVMRQSVLETLHKEPLDYVLFWKKYLNSLEDIGLRVDRDLRFLFGQGEYELYEVVK